MIKNSSRVSIIIPNWNGEEFIGKCLDSILVQTFQNWEVIVVDCASSDKSAEIILQYTVKNPNINLLQLTEDKGPTNALMEGFKQKAKGDYILFLNNDVILPSDVLEILVKEIQKRGDVVISPVELDWKGNFRRAGGPFILPGMQILKHFFEPIIEPFHPLMACCLCPRKIIQEYPLNEHLIMYEELEWAWRLHLNQIKIIISFDCAYLHKAEATNKRGSSRQTFLYSRLMISQCYICFKKSTLIFMSPFIFLYYVKLLGFALLSGGLSSCSSAIKGLVDFYRNKHIFQKDREVVQRGRLDGDRQIIARMLGSNIFRKKAKLQWETQKNKNHNYD